MDNPRRFWKPSRAARINIRSYRRPLRSCHHRRGSAARRVRFEDVRHRPLSDFAEQVRVRDDDLGGGLFTQGGVEAVVERLAAERNVEKRGAAAVFEHAELCDNKFDELLISSATVSPGRTPTEPSHAAKLLESSSASSYVIDPKPGPGSAISTNVLAPPSEAALAHSSARLQCDLA
eukprot:CAMPEP_0184257794 /NCGR_PEP_ID=MMETSP0977-20130417/9609_1 /TAXON_ID=483370 /ORGANISM="non described non described, Strain CCMP2097" /LENGTH=176 /DNA_ID=CAMNT_0026563407 /DNA_START=439 /DNA_END=967 /DNA_ORIENTATION=+